MVERGPKNVCVFKNASGAKRNHRGAIKKSQGVHEFYRGCMKKKFRRASRAGNPAPPGQMSVSAPAKGGHTDKKDFIFMAPPKFLKQKQKNCPQKCAEMTSRVLMSPEIFIKNI